MVGIVLISHGSFCEGLLDTLQMVAGSDYGIKTVSLLPGESPESYREKLSKVLDENGAIDKNGTIILSDIAGGTPFQSAVYLSKKYNIGLVSGMNLPIVLTLALESSSGKTMEKMIEEATAAPAIGVEVQLFEKGGKTNRAKLSIDKD